MLHLVRMVRQGHNADNVERLWEAQLQQLGTEGYEQSLHDKKGNLVDFHTTAAGKWFMQHAHRTVEAALTELQRGVFDPAPRGSHTRETMASLPMVHPRNLTGITLKAMIDRTMGNSEERNRGVAMQSLIQSVSKGVELTLKLMCDIQESREDAKRWFEEHGGDLGTPPLSLAEKYLKENGCSRMSQSRWKGALKETLDYKWSLAKTYYCGDALVLTTVEALKVEAEARGHHAPFEVHNPLVNSKRARRVRITSEFADLLEQKEVRRAENQVIRLPMLTRPAPWVVE